MRRNLLRPVLFLAGAFAFLAMPSMARANDAMFPAQAAAAASIGWKNNYFLVNGKPTVLSSGEIHYARVPRELWRERLMKAKRAGLNTIQTYSFWSAHEPTEDTFDFTDNLDLDAWLTLIEELGMYSIVRPGPYNCAEWVSGGIPLWLTSKSDMQIRANYKPYVDAADKYYGKIIPILAKHQIHKGGSLIALQLENEYPNAWGTDSTPFLQHLYDQARGLGIEVLLFNSGMHHDHDPTGTAPFGNRTYPWYSTEFWSGWFSGGIGEMGAAELSTLTRGAWKVVAFGGGGHDYYVFHGGTNFGYSGMDTIASYDYRAPLGEEGQMRKAYQEAKRVALFTRAFEPLLATSTDGASLVGQVANGLKTYVRKTTGDGIAVFLDNQGSSPIQTKVKLTTPAIEFPSGTTQLSVAAGEIRPVIVSARFTANASLAYLATNVLGKTTLGTKTYYVCHGRPGESGEIAIQYTNAPATPPGTPWIWDASAKIARATFTYPTGDTIIEAPIDSGDGGSAVFLVIDTALAERTWFTDKALYLGATYVGDDLSVDMPAAGGKVVTYTADGRTEATKPTTIMPTAPTLGTWQWRDAAPEAVPSYADSTWASSPQPLPYGANNFQNAYGWYRGKFTATSAGNVTMNIEGVRASAMVFANGNQVRMTGTSATFPQVAGENTVAILATHDGLPTLYNVTGTVGTTLFTGIWGKVTNGAATLANAWRFRGGLAGLDETQLIGRVTNWSAFLTGDWSATATIKAWPAFWKTTFPSPLKTGVFATLGLRTTGLSSGSVWLNGRNVGRVSSNALLYLPEPWLEAENTLVIYDATGNAPTGTKLEFFETRARFADPGAPVPGTGGSIVLPGTGGTDAGMATGGAIPLGGTTASGGSPRSGGSSPPPSGGSTSTSGGANSTGGLATGGVHAGGGARTGGDQNVGRSGGAPGGSTVANSTSNSGCGCDLGGRAPTSPAWLLLGLPWLLRRRRS